MVLSPHGCVLTLLSQLENCDGFAVESPAGCIGWVEETWLDDVGHPAALALRTADGRRALLFVDDDIRAVDPEASEVFVAPHPILRGLGPPRLKIVDGAPIASWPAGDTLVPAPPAVAQGASAGPALAAARISATSAPRPVLQTIAALLTGLSVLVAFEIGLVFLVTYLVTGRLT